LGQIYTDKGPVQLLRERCPERASFKKFLVGAHALLLERGAREKHQRDETDRKEFFLMNEPVTTIEQRYSEPNAVATPWEETRRVLEAAELFWLSTVRDDGRPHATPLVAVWLDGAIHFSAGAEEQKSVNRRGNSHVLLTTNCTWNEGLAIVVEGDAVQVSDDEMLKRLASAWTAKWDG
jgi:predicted pyridoxine 5'-phosphate oxidase superfamily flavin-nucleotide-binding protein